MLVRSDWAAIVRRSSCGGGPSRNGGSRAFPGAWQINRGLDGRGVFPPEQIIQAKAIACERPAAKGLPLSRFSLSEVRDWLLEAKVVSQVSRSTVWRWLDEDALRPWRFRTWLFARDPQFEQKAAVVLDLYHRTWQGQPLGPGDYVLSADEKTQLQVLERCAPTQPPQAGQAARVEFEYRRHGTLAYLATMDVASGHVHGRIETTTGIEPFMQLVDQVMTQEPYASAERVFWIVDNGSSHHPSTFPERLKARYPNAIAVMLPTHASWLNQIELYFSILQRKALTPRDLVTRADMSQRVLGFQQRHNLTAQPFTWNFTRAQLLARCRLLAAA